MKIQSSIRCALVSATAMVTISAISPAWAQEGSDDRQIGLDEIVVTAQKRAENLQDVPIAVSAINAAQIERTFSRNISELGSMAPNLIVDTIFGVATPAISIRGLQLNDGEKSFDPAVAVYLDGVYLSTTTGALLTTFDAEAVEVLRGPQGTLFGRNTIGGLVHVRRAEPTGELGGKVAVTYGRFDQLDVKAVLNLPSIANGAIAAKVGVMSLNGGGYFHNITRGKREGNNDFMMYSAALKIEPSPDFKLNLAYDYIDDKTNTRPVTALTSPTETFCAITPAGFPCGQPAANASYHRHPIQNFVQPQGLKGHSLIANAELNLAEDHALFAVVGYRDAKEYSVQKWDGIQLPYFFTYRPQKQDQFSAELRYQGEVGIVKMVAGAYYYEAGYTNHQQTFFFTSNFPTNASEKEVLAGIRAGWPGEVPGTDTDQDSKNYAFFGQLDWEIVENLNVSAGGRYTKETKHFCGANALGPVGSRVVVGSFGDCPDSWRSQPTYMPNAVNPTTGEVFEQTGRDSWSRFTPRFGVDYKFDNGMVYASYSKGFRSGGYNGRGTDSFNMGPYQPETVESYEAGFKTQWADNRVRFNLSAFSMNYSNKQEDVVFPDPVSVTVTVVQNAARARIRGFEAEFQAVPADGLTFGVNVGHLNAKYRNWQDIGFNLDPATAAADPFVTIDKSNFKLRRAPKWSLDATMNYRHELENDHALVFDVGVRLKSDYYIVANTLTPANPNNGLVKSFALLDASISYDADNWRLSFFGKNLTNHDYFSHVLDVGTSYGATPTNSTPVPQPGLFTYGSIAPPRTWGIEALFKF
ncbi:TonB-dependent receptor [Sphingosinicella microcystinivorans]|uniref:Iron complex outermembrane receptor protein n=3 Tax=Sphingosinicella microcystinivorans TaxID=335406 RepID=A0ABX9SVA5_SPHMI|nr:TonB-dependent receptor [Sphingosinicella microcystinivorans]RKS86293.1 iron complex outermembrane receptor protein [Sphingosinicella microcystinivorans]